MKNRRKRAVFRKSYKTNNREKQSLFLPVSEYSEERGNAGVIQGGAGGENEVQEKTKDISDQRRKKYELWNRQAH